MALASNYNRLTFQGWIEEFFHRDEEGVHVNVEDGPGGSGHGSTSQANFFRPFGAGLLPGIYPGLTPWAAFFRRFAADGLQGYAMPRLRVLNQNWLRVQLPHLLV